MLGRGRWNRYQIVLAAVIVVSAALVVISCYTTSQYSGTADQWPKLIVYNEAGGIIKVMDESGRTLGRATGGRSEIRLRYLSYSAQYLQFKITGDQTIYRSPPESIWSQTCWQVTIGVMAPERDIWTTFLPCGGPETATLVEGTVFGFPDSIRTIVTRNPRPIRDPITQKLYYRITEQCLGVQGHLEEVVWHVADAILSIDGSRFEWCKGIWIIKDDGTRLVILDARWALNPQTITHESLHDITERGDGDPVMVAAQEKCEYGYVGGGQ